MKDIIHEFPLVDIVLLIGFPSRKTLTLSTFGMRSSGIVALTYPAVPDGPLTSKFIAVLVWLKNTDEIVLFESTAKYTSSPVCSASNVDWVIEELG